ncbi:MAG: glycosyltransferase family 4 protein [Cyanobacteria bacterium J06635_1]
MVRLAWLLTASHQYWHATLAHLAEKYPNLRVFVVNWPGYAHGYSDAFSVSIVGQRTLISPQLTSSGYRPPKLTLLPLGLIPKLWQWHPELIFTNSFGMWTLLVLLLKPIRRWRVIIAYEGSAPNIDYRNSVWRLRLRRWMTALADACITNSQRGKTYLTHTLQVPTHKVFAHPYEVPDKITLNAPCDRRPVFGQTRPRFLYVGQLIPRKGLDCLLEACQKLYQSYGNAFSLLILGQGHQQNDLENRCQQTHLTDVVHWLGPVTYGHLGQYYTAADVLVFPTYEDTWGMVVLEAMLFAKPVICSEGAGASEQVIGGKTGYHVPPNDSCQLSEKMARFIETPTLAATLGHQAQAHMQNYTPEQAAQFLSQVTQTVISPMVSAKP